MICPLCERDNPGDALECAGCGKRLLEEIALDPEGDALAGQEHTQLGADDLDTAFAMAALDSDGVAPLDGLERTQLGDPTLEVQVERLALDGDESAAAAPGAGGSAKAFWTSELLEMESGRDEDLAPRTPEPVDTGVCPWCGAPGDGAVCNHCGRRRRRFTRDRDRPLMSTGETTLCPACFCRVAADARCEKCQAPLPRMEGL